MSPTTLQLAQLRGYVCNQCLRQISRQRPQSRSLHASQRRKQEQKSILAVLEERGYVNQIAGDRNTLDRLLRTRKVGFYAGIDPTAPSLHLGHLLPLMVLFWLNQYGHHVVSLVGAATARVGDPSGRLTSRARTDEDVHATNFKAMRGQVGRIWDNAVKYGQRHGYDGEARGMRDVFDNGAWLDQLTVMDFLKMMGNGVRVGTMLGRDTVRNKMEKGDGMSFSEFTYPLLQAWDWWHMFQKSGVQVQIGGSDQYGNIIAGMDAVKYIAQSGLDDSQQAGWLDTDGKLLAEMSPMGLTVPLLTTTSGEKFGKSAGNAVWLDRTMTSPFDLYGFLLRSSDEDVGRYLKLFTFVTLDEVEAVMEEHAADPGKRKAQHLLAKEVLELVHGPEEATKTQKDHESSRNPSIAALSSPVSEDGNAEPDPDTAAKRIILPLSFVNGEPFSRVLYRAGIAASRSDGARMVSAGGISIATSDPTAGDPSALTFVQLRNEKSDNAADYILNGMLIFRQGKWKTRVVEVVADGEFDARKLEAMGWEQWKAARHQKEGSL